MNKESLLIGGVGGLALIAIVAWLVLSPAGGDFGRREVAGPPEIRSEVVNAHAEQFDEELPDRVAGSQQEQAAATYLLGVFQRNGYVVRLEAVPVADLVSSTDLIAIPPGVEEPSALVVAPYGSAADASDTGLAVGVMLEVARALNVAEPDHTVGFAAVGAEFSDEGEGSLGSRRLVQLLLDRDERPAIVQLVDVGPNVDLSSTGPDDRFGTRGSVSLDSDVFAAAGFTRYLLEGPPDAIGRALLQGLRNLRQ